MPRFPRGYNDMLGLPLGADSEVLRENWERARRKVCGLTLGFLWYQLTNASVRRVQA